MPFSLFGFLVFACCAVPSLAATFDQIVFFGDSLTDTGNTFSRHGIPTKPYYAGRFTNGLTWADILASQLGLDAKCSSAGGTNYAWGGATTGDNDKPVLSLGPQLAEFKDSKVKLSSDGLIVVWIGGNDHQAGISPEATIRNIRKHIKTLVEIGAKNFLVGNIGIGGKVGNKLLERAIEDLEDNNRGVTIAIFDLESLILRVRENPTEFDLVSTDPACKDCGMGMQQDAGNIVENPDIHSRWDEVHPSKVMHQVIAKEVLKLLSSTYRGRVPLVVPSAAKPQ